MHTQCMQEKKALKALNDLKSAWQTKHADHLASSVANAISGSQGVNQMEGAGQSGGFMGTDCSHRRPVTEYAGGGMQPLLLARSTT